MGYSKSEHHVLAHASPRDEEQAACAACEDQEAATEEASPTAELPQSFREALEAIPLDWDDWELEEDLRRANRYPRPSVGAKARTSSSPATAAISTIPLGLRREPDSPRRRRSTGFPFFSWAMLALSLMAFVCGAVLVGWSFYTGRPDLWRLGMPLTLVGQAGWLIGIVMQLDGLWQGHRDAFQALDDLDRRLDELRQAAETLSSSRRAA